ncbi:RNA-binding domain-containing protein, partial [Pseudovirgaria hyperparasitica]
TEDQLERVFSPFGKIAHISLVCDNRGLSRGFGFIRFERPEDADAACSSLNQQVFEGRRMVVSKQTVKPSRRTIPDITTMGEPTRTLFIGNMSFEMSDKDLNDLFRDVRNVLDVRVAVDRRTGQPRGFAHADFTDAESAKQAAELLAGKSVYGRQLRVDFSRPSSQNRQV